MRYTRQGRSMQKPCRSLVLAVCIVLFPLGILLSQKAPSPPPGPKYDLQTEVKIKGTVLELKPSEKAKDVLHLVVKSGEETIDVSLCPKSYLDEMGTTFNKGDEIALTGSKVKVDEASLILAREVNKGEEMLMLRDGKGVPVWNWKH
ncbi:MAG TPA: hypothetical protein VLK33_04690 [Terriglobales bacterium]|nr:hypothetical protein [Terriglobales bacterium]